MTSFTGHEHKANTLSGILMLILIVALLTPSLGMTAPLLHLDKHSIAQLSTADGDCPHHTKQYSPDTIGMAADCAGNACAQCQCLTALLALAPANLLQRCSHTVQNAFSQALQHTFRLERPPKLPLV